MRETLNHICSVKEICSDCPFLKSTTDPDLLNLRKYHLVEMRGDLLYRPHCKAKASELAEGDHPLCRGAAVYMAKTGKLNAVLKLALDEGVVSKVSLAEEADRVID